MSWLQTLILQTDSSAMPIFILQDSGQYRSKTVGVSSEKSSEMWESVSRPRPPIGRISGKCPKLLFDPNRKPSAVLAWCRPSFILVLTAHALLGQSILHPLSGSRAPLKTSSRKIRGIIPFPAFPGLFSFFPLPPAVDSVWLPEEWLLSV